MTGDLRRNEGLFHEDFTVGDVFRHPLGRTVGEADNRWFTLLTMNTNELHYNADFASRTEHGRELVNSGLTVALVLGLSVSDISQNAVANLGWQDITLRAPVFVGDTLYGESLNHRPPGVGIPTVCGHRLVLHPRHQPGRGRGAQLPADSDGLQA